MGRFSRTMGTDNLLGHEHSWRPCRAILFEYDRIIHASGSPLGLRLSGLPFLIFLIIQCPAFLDDLADRIRLGFHPIH